MLSWRPSSLSRICKPALLILIGSSSLIISPALANRSSRGRHPNPSHNAPSRSPNPTGVIELGKATPENPAVQNSLRGCNSKSILTVATYNVENFWDDIEENSGASTYDEYKKGGSNWYTDKMYEQKAKNLADAILMAGAPDIVAMQEIESGNNSSRSLEILKPYVASMGYKYFALGLQNDKNQVAVTSAVMSKFPITSNTHLDFNMSESPSSSHDTREEPAVSSSSSARDPQAVTIDINGIPLRLYTVHLKSRRGDFASGEAMRLAAASLVKRDIDKQRESKPSLDILVMGDFNANESERPLTEGLLSTDDKNTLARDSSDTRMYNLWFELPSAERCSYMHGGQLQCLDHILTSASLFDGQGIDLVESSFQVVGHNGGDAAQRLVKSDGKTPFRWGMQKSDRGARFTGTGYSDHLPLVATFKMPGRCNLNH